MFHMRFQVFVSFARPRPSWVLPLAYLSFGGAKRCGCI
jgi:hypothetical protein